MLKTILIILESFFFKLKKFLCNKKTYEKLLYFNFNIHFFKRSLPD